MRINQITFTRFVAAIAIVIYHFGNNLFVYKIKYIQDIFSKANIGVSYFFILSGFIMIVAYNAKGKINYLDFYKNRFARIYPLYVLGLLLFFLIRYNAEIYKIVLYLFGFQTWFPGEALILNYPGWSISVEFFFYLIFPFLYNFIYSKKIKFIWIIIALIWIVTQFYSNYYIFSGLYKGIDTKSHDFIFYFPLLHLNEFLVGNLAGFFVINNFKQKNYDWSITFLFILILLSLFLPLFFHNGLLAILFIPLIIMISFNNGKITKLFALKSLEYLGEISYAIYITHIPILNILRQFLRWKKIEMDFNLQFFVYIIILMICSSVFYQFIEKPFRDYLKKIKFSFT